MEYSDTLVRCIFRNLNITDSDKCIFHLLSNQESYGGSSPTDSNVGAQNNESEWIWLFYAQRELMLQFKLCQCAVGEFDIVEQENLEGYHEFTVPPLNVDQAVSIDLRWNDDFESTTISIDDILNENEELFEKLPVMATDHDLDDSEVVVEQNNDMLTTSKFPEKPLRISPKIHIKMTTTSLDSICGSSSEVEEIMSHQNINKLSVLQQSKYSSSDPVSSSSDRVLSEIPSKVTELPEEDEVFQVKETEDGLIDIDKLLFEMGSESLVKGSDRVIVKSSSIEVVPTRSHVIVAKIQALFGFGFGHKKGVEKLEHNSQEEFFDVKDNEDVLCNMEQVTEENVSYVENSTEKLEENVEENVEDKAEDHSQIYVENKKECKRASKDVEISDISDRPPSNEEDDIITGFEIDSYVLSESLEPYIPPTSEALNVESNKNGEESNLSEAPEAADHNLDSLELNSVNGTSLQFGCQSGISLIDDNLTTTETNSYTTDISDIETNSLCLVDRNESNVVNKKDVVISTLKYTVVDNSLNIQSSENANDKYDEENKNLILLDNNPANEIIECNKPNDDMKYPDTDYINNEIQTEKCEEYNVEIDKNVSNKAIDSSITYEGDIFHSLLKDSDAIEPGRTPSEEFSNGDIKEIKNLSPLSEDYVSSISQISETVSLESKDIYCGEKKSLVEGNNIPNVDDKIITENSNVVSRLSNNDEIESKETNVKIVDHADLDSRQIVEEDTGLLNIPQLNIVEEESGDILAVDDIEALEISHGDKDVLSIFNYVYPRSIDAESNESSIVTSLSKESIDLLLKDEMIDEKKSFNPEKESLTSFKLQNTNTAPSISGNLYTLYSVEDENCHVEQISDKGENLTRIFGTEEEDNSNVDALIEYGNDHFENSYASNSKIFEDKQIQDCKQMYVAKSLSSNKDSAIVCDLDSQYCVGTTIPGDSYEDFLSIHPMTTSQTVDSLFMSTLSSNKQCSLDGDVQVFETGRQDALGNLQRYDLKLSSEAVCESEKSGKNVIHLGNDDFLFNNSLSPTRVESQLINGGLEYDFPYIDDEPYYYEEITNFKSCKILLRAKMAYCDDCSLSSVMEVCESPGREVISSNYVKKPKSRNRFYKLCGCFIRKRH